jgi:hypothetical protein
MQKMGNIRRFVLAGAVCGAAALTATGQAAAKGCSGVNPNSVPSSVSQYTEMVPTSCGSAVSGSGTHKTKLPRGIQQKITKQGGSATTQTLLTNIATSEKYGAPLTLPKSHLKITKGPKTTTGGRSALSASVSVVTDGSDGRLIGLVALMACIAVVALGASVYRRRAVRQ